MSCGHFQIYPLEYNDEYIKVICLGCGKIWLRERWDKCISIQIFD